MLVPFIALIGVVILVAFFLISNGKKKQKDQTRKGATPGTEASGGAAHHYN